jgi:hypothetical protein
MAASLEHRPSRREPNCTRPTQPYLSLVVADLLIQILIIYIVLKMGASTQLRHYHCHLTQVENGGLRIVFKPKYTVDDASDTASYTQLDD